MYHYAGNNPVKYIDPDGRLLDTVFDAIGIAWDVIDIVATPTNPFAWAALAADVGCLFIPGATGAGRAIKAAEKASKISKTVKLFGKVDDFVDAIKSGERIFGSYKDLKKMTKGFNHAIEAHHLIPQALAKNLGKNANDFASVILDQATHQGFTKGWASKLNDLKKIENRDKLIIELRSAIKEIYENSPELLKVAEEWLNTL